MIEKTVLDFLDEELSVPVWMEIPEGETLPDKFVLLEKTGSRSGDHIRSATLAVQSYADSIYNFTDREKKQYRYQAVYVITHY